MCIMKYQKYMFHNLKSANKRHFCRYNPDHPDQVTTVSIKGDVEAVLRDADRTEVIVQVSNLLIIPQWICEHYELVTTRKTKYLSI